MKKKINMLYNTKPKKLSIILVGALSCMALFACNSNNAGVVSTNTTKGDVQSQPVKYDNDQVKGIWAAVNGYDGSSINPTINMLAQNNTDSMMTFIGCENVSGSEAANFSVKSFTDKPINYTKTYPSKFQEFADNYSGGYLIDSLDKQPTLQQIKFSGGDYSGDNKKQCYFAIGNKDNLKPLYVKLVLDTKKIVTYDASQGVNPWKSKPIEDLSKLSADSKKTFQSLVSPKYSSQLDATNLSVIDPAIIETMIKDYFGQLYDYQKIMFIRQYLSLRWLGLTQNLNDIMELNTLLRRLYYARGNQALATEIMDHIVSRFVVLDGGIPQVGRFMINEATMHRIFNQVAIANNVHYIPEITLNNTIGNISKHYRININGVEMQNVTHTRYSYAAVTDEQYNLMRQSFVNQSQFADGYLRDLAASNVDREILANICIMPPGNNLSVPPCTPLEDAIKATEKSTFNEASSIERLSIKGTDIEMANFSKLSKLEAQVTENAVKRAGGAVGGKAMGEIGISAIAGAMGGPVGFIAEQLIFDQLIGLAMHGVSAPKDDIRVTGMQWEVVDAGDAVRWNAKNKDNQIEANAVKTLIIDSSMANAIRVSYAAEAGEVRDNQLNYTLKLDTLSTPFIRPDSSSETDPWLKDIAENVGHKGADAGSSVIKLSLDDDSDNYQNKDVDSFILKQVGLDAYVPDYLSEPTIKSTAVSTFGNTLNMNQLTSVSSHSGLALTKVGKDIEGLFISPGTVLKLGLNIPKSGKSDAPSLGQRLIANYSGIGPSGEVVNYGSVGSQSMFNALAESKDSLPLLFTGFDCSYPYKLGDTCTATLALSQSNQNQKSQGKLYLQDVNGEAVSLPTYIGYTTVVEPYIVEGEAGSDDSGTIYLADVSGGKLSKLQLTLPMDFLKSGTITFSCNDSALEKKVETTFVRSPSTFAASLMKVNNISFRHGVNQTANVSTITPPQCTLKVNLRNIKEGTYSIVAKSIRSDGTTDTEYSKVEATAPF